MQVILREATGRFRIPALVGEPLRPSRFCGSLGRRALLCSTAGLMERGYCARLWTSWRILATPPASVTV